jgi:DNA-binding transcriptional LysR family regulator
MMDDITNGDNPPDFRLLVTFSHVARLGSMTAAAGVLGYVPSAISQQISALERSLGGVELFTRRTGRGLAVTAAGRSLAEAVDELLVATATYQDMAHSVSRGEGMELRVGAYETAVSHLLPVALTELVDADSKTMIRVIEVETRDGLPMLERGELDLLVASRYVQEDPPYQSDKLTIKTLGREELLLTSSSGSGNVTPSFSQCKYLDWVAGAADDIDRKLLHRWAGITGFDPQVRFETRSCHTAVELIASGLAVGLIPASVIDAYREPMNLSLVELPSLPPTREVLAITRARFNMPIVNDLLELLGDVPYFK